MTKRIEVLLVEDNDADADLIRETLDPNATQLRFSVARDGVEAMELLRQKCGYGRTVRPDLILLDLGLPRKNGWEVLLEMRNDPSLRLIPVVVLTSSDAEADVVRSYDFGASCYVKKPGNLLAFQETMQALSRFWFNTVQLPPAPNRP